MDLPDLTITYYKRRIQTTEPQREINAKVRPLVEAMVDRIISRTKYQPVKDSYSLSVRGNQYFTEYAVRNDSEIWRFEEHGTSPHDIPQPPHFIPREPLIEWMKKEGIPLGFVSYIENVLSMRGWVTHHPGTEGDHIMQEEVERALPEIKAAIHGQLNFLSEADPGGMVVIGKMP